MTEFELVEAFYLVQGNLQNSFQTISTVIFAYVVASHFVGKGLGRGTSIMLSIIYSLVVLLPIIGRMSEYSRWHRIHTEYLEMFADGVVFVAVGPSLSTMNILGVAPFLVAWAMSLIYLHVIVRRQSIEPR